MSVYIGPAGWSYKDWVGIVYPDSLKPSDYLQYLTQFFDVVEIDSSYYRPPTVRMVDGWLEKVGTNRAFKFTMKLWSEFTHKPEMWMKESEALFKKGARLLLESGRMGALLAQFSFSFQDNKENRQRLSIIAESFREYPLVVEVRHSSWNTPESIEFIRSLNIGFCNIDQPGSRTSLTGTDYVTSDVGYIRLHGRNYDTWFKKGATVEEKYDYLYTEEELGYWIKVVKRLAIQTKSLFAIFNNHFQGKAVVNALQMKSILSGECVTVPRPLCRRYEVLNKIASVVDSQQRELF